MKYEIQTPEGVPSNVVEASVSTEPDDVSVASIRIVASLRDLDDDGTIDETIDDLDHVTFTVPLALTTNPRSITPQAADFGSWDLRHLGDGRFRAVRDRTTSGPWVFHLHDIEVTTGAGTADIEVVETRNGVDAAPQRLQVRKVDPRLRIDYFRAVTSSSDHGPVAPVVQSGQSVTLAWATTAATSVELWGPGGKIGPADDATDDEKVTWRDHSKTQTVGTTSTYTLVAWNGSAHTVAQVTITVPDRAEIPELVASESVTIGARTLTIDTNQNLAVDGGLAATGTVVVDGARLRIGNWTLASHADVGTKTEELIVVCAATRSWWWRFRIENNGQPKAPGLDAPLPTFDSQHTVELGQRRAPHVPGSETKLKVNPQPLPTWFTTS
jgi:hypothetical protein